MFASRVGAHIQSAQMLCRLAVLVALVAAVACAARSDPFQWSQCGDRKFGVVNNVTLAPYPAQKGKKATAVALVRIAQVITSGTWDLKLKLHGIIPAPGQNGGICDVVSGGCPVKVGLHNATIVIPVYVAAAMWWCGFSFSCAYAVWPGRTLPRRAPTRAACWPPMATASRCCAST